jgi:hypothetical protein
LPDDYNFHYCVQARIYRLKIESTKALISNIIEKHNARMKQKLYVTIFSAWLAVCDATGKAGESDPTSFGNDPVLSDYGADALKAFPLTNLPPPEILFNSESSGIRCPPKHVGLFDKKIVTALNYFSHQQRSYPPTVSCRVTQSEKTLAYGGVRG